MPPIPISIVDWVGNFVSATWELFVTTFLKEGTHFLPSGCAIWRNCQATQRIKSRGANERWIGRVCAATKVTEELNIEQKSKYNI